MRSGVTTGFRPRLRVATALSGIGYFSQVPGCCPVCVFRHIFPPSVFITTDTRRWHSALLPLWKRDGPSQLWVLYLQVATKRTETVRLSRPAANHRSEQSQLRQAVLERD